MLFCRDSELYQSPAAAERDGSYLARFSDAGNVDVHRSHESTFPAGLEMLSDVHKFSSLGHDQRNSWSSIDLFRVAQNGFD